MFKKLLIALTLASLFVLSGCEHQAEKPVKVSLSTVKKMSTATEQKTDHNTLRVAISAVISPKETFVLYNDLLNYISKKLERTIELTQRKTYEEVNNLVKDNVLDIAFVCSGAYVAGHDQFGMELLVAPVAYGEPVYHSYIIVPQDSPAQQFEDLRGKSFAFTDPMSNTGKLSPTYLLTTMNETPDSFFSEYIFTYSHDRSIEMVAHGLVSGAAIDGLIWEYMNLKHPETTNATRIIKKSEPYGIPPVVVSSSIDKELKDKLQKIFLNIHLDKEGKKIIETLFIDRFVIMADKQYDSIRRMQKVVPDQ